MTLIAVELIDEPDPEIPVTMLMPLVDVPLSRLTPLKEAEFTVLESCFKSWLMSVWMAVVSVPLVCALITSDWIDCITVSILSKAELAVPRTDVPKFKALETESRSLFCVRMLVAIDQ